eukprot:scaffold20979_cov94-Skeletonema_dohrnii-CCMP3373.AAC.2
MGRILRRRYSVIVERADIWHKAGCIVLLQQASQNSERKDVPEEPSRSMPVLQMERRQISDDVELD